MGAQRSAIAQNFISSKVCEALSRHGIGHDDPIREELEKDAEVAGVRDACVRVRGGSIDDRIAELRRDPRFASSFPADPPKVARSDMAKLRENFAAIAGGKVAVE